MDNVTFDTENDINIKITKKDGGTVLNEDCCTCINILLTNDGKIATSFLGCHNPYIVLQLEKAQKVYFKELKKALKRDFKEYGTLPEDECDCESHHKDDCSDDDCCCHEHHHEHCNCEENDDEKHCNCENEHNEHKHNHDNCDCDKKNKNKKENCTCNKEKSKNKNCKNKKETSNK